MPGSARSTRLWIWLLVATGWWLANGIASATHFVLASGAMGDPVRWERALTQTLTSAVLWIPVTMLAVLLAERWPIERGNLPRALAVHLAATAGVIVMRALAVIVLDPWVRWYEAGPPPFARVLLTSFFNNFFLYALIVGVAHGVYYGRQARERTAQLTRARLQVLKAQLHPHFLFNALNTVSSLVQDDPLRAERVLSRLSAFLRVTLDEAGTVEVPLRDEVQLVATYLEIEQARFEDRLRVVWSVDPATLDARVPHLILQPLVENAVRHGIAPRAAPGEITIVTSTCGGRLTMEVRDDGVGFEHPYPAPNGNGAGGGGGGGLGLANTRARLTHLYGDRQTLEVRSRPGEGTVVALNIPLRGGGEQDS